MERLNARYAAYVLQAVEFQLRSIDQGIIDEIQTSSLFTRFFESSGDDSLLHLEMVRKLRSLMLQYPLIDSVYIVRVTDGKTLTSSTSTYLNEFGDAAFFMNNMKSEVNQNWTSLREFHELEAQKLKNVVSLFRRYPILSGEYGGVVINISEQNLRSFLMEAQQDTVSYTELYDAKGNQIFESDMNRHKEPPITELSSSYTGWKLLSGARSTEGGLMWWFSVGNRWVFSALLLIFAGGLLIFYASIRNYRPVRKISDTLRSFYMRTNLNPPDDPVNDHGIFEKSLDELVDISKKYWNQSNEVQQLSRRHFFREIVEGSRRIGHDEWNAAMHTYAMPGQLSFALVVNVEIDHYTDFQTQYNCRDQQLLKYVLATAHQEAAQKEPQLHLWQEWIAPMRITAIVRFNSLSAKENVLHVYKQLQSWAQEHLSFSVTIGLGEVVHEPGALVESYEQALEAARYKLVLGTGMLISYRDVPVGEKEELYNNFIQLRSAVDLYRLGKDHWENKLSELFDSLKVDWFSSEDMRSLLNYFIYHLEREMRKLPPQWYQEWNTAAYERLNQAADRAEHLDELLKEWITILQECRLCFADRLHTLQHYSVIRDVRAYLENHYSDADMSLIVLSDRFNINAKYLSQLFKEAFGEKFIDVLLKLRMEKAKELLRDTALAIQDIAIQVGYTNAISFSQAFKKLHGISPSYYRKSLTGMESSENNEVD
ncbi:helix-turn-helix domain-containing protein [Paenibacillus algicola]|nr:helix-turn-helix domain-containing protein [Paenibacillus algicola]